MTVDCTLRQASLCLSSKALIDTGASGKAYISQSYARRHGLRMDLLDHPIDVYGFDGAKSVTGKIQYTTTVELSHVDHVELITMYVTTIGSHPIILGLPWMREHCVIPNWKNECLKFTAEHCRTKCLNHKLLARRARRTPRSRSQPEAIKPQPESRPELRYIDIRMISAPAFNYLSKQHEHEIFAISMADIEKALAPKQETDPATKVPKEYHDLLFVFRKSESDKLPEHRPYDHKIKLEPGKQHGLARYMVCPAAN